MNFERKTEPANVFLGLGSNIGDRLFHLHQAINMIEERLGNILAKSGIYETEPWGNRNQDSFLNMVVQVTVSLTAAETLNILKEIELQMGRKKKIHWGPRIIDIDILFFNNEIFKEANLEVPHPQIAQRLFVLRPLSEIAPEYVHPVFNKKMIDLLSDCSDSSIVTLYKT